MSSTVLNEPPVVQYAANVLIFFFLNHTAFASVKLQRCIYVFLKIFLVRVLKQS